MTDLRWEKYCRSFLYSCSCAGERAPQECPDCLEAFITAITRLKDEKSDSYVTDEEVKQFHDRSRPHHLTDLMKDLQLDGMIVSQGFAVNFEGRLTYEHPERAWFFRMIRNDRYIDRFVTNLDKARYPAEKLDEELRSLAHRLDT